MGHGGRLQLLAKVSPVCGISRIPNTRYPVILSEGDEGSAGIGVFRVDSEVSAALDPFPDKSRINRTEKKPPYTAPPHPCLIGDLIQGEIAEKREDIQFGFLDRVFNGSRDHMRTEKDCRK